ncbi:hypothetical protein [Nannocystis pusilla]
MRQRSRIRRPMMGLFHEGSDVAESGDANLGLMVGMMTTRTKQ